MRTLAVLAVLALVACAPRDYGRWRWVGAATTVAAYSAAVTAAALNGDQACDLAPGQLECPRVYDTVALSAVLLGVAGGSTAATCAMFYQTEMTEAR